jgi:ATP-dependent Clp protease ATP-binding subunit ClpX
MILTADPVELCQVHLDSAGDAEMAKEEALDTPGRTLAIASLKQVVCHCSFCGRDQLKVKAVVAGPAVFICNKCIGICQKTLDEHAKSGKAETPKVRYGATLLDLPTKNLCSALVSQEKAIERVRSQMQTTVEILRSRNVSWSVIGEALGVSRQAAWERFS